MGERGCSQRRACDLALIDPKAVRRGPIADSPEIRARLRELTGRRRRVGCRRLGALLQREGTTMNARKLLRLCRKGPSARRRRGREGATGTRAPMAIPQEPGQRGSLNVVSSVPAGGRRFGVLAIVDHFTREAPALDVDTSISGSRVARELDTPIAARGASAMVVSDAGTELTSRAVLGWTNRTRLDRRRIAPGKPRQSAFVGVSDARFRGGCLSEEVFGSLAEARAVVGAGGATATPRARLGPWRPDAHRGARADCRRPAPTLGGLRRSAATAGVEARPSTPRTLGRSRVSARAGHHVPLAGLVIRGTGTKPWSEP